MRASALESAATLIPRKRIAVSAVTAAGATRHADSWPKASQQSRKTTSNFEAGKVGPKERNTTSRQKASGFACRGAPLNPSGKAASRVAASASTP